MILSQIARILLNFTSYFVYNDEYFHFYLKTCLHPPMKMATKQKPGCLTGDKVRQPGKRDVYTFS